MIPPDDGLLTKIQATTSKKPVYVEMCKLRKEGLFPIKKSLRYIKATGNIEFFRDYVRELLKEYAFDEKRKLYKISVSLCFEKSQR